MVNLGEYREFQSPLGEVVKETSCGEFDTQQEAFEFQSPLGEVVKETDSGIGPSVTDWEFQSPLGEVVKETSKPDSDPR